MSSNPFIRFDCPNGHRIVRLRPDYLDGAPYLQAEDAVAVPPGFLLIESSAVPLPGKKPGSGPETRRHTLRCPKPKCGYVGSYRWLKLVELYDTARRVGASSTRLPS